MKRILFMHQVSSIGGASYCMLSLVKAIDKSKFKPIVMLRNEGSLADEIRKIGVEVVFFPGMPTVPYNQSLMKFKTVKTYCKVFAAQRKFGTILANLNVDAVYINNMMLYPYLKTAKAKGCNTIMHVREHWPETEHQKQMEKARQYAEKYADAVIAINKYSASLFPECSNKMTIIHDWIDLSERFEERPFEEIFGDNYENIKVLLFTGGLAKIKGTLEIVKLFSERIKGSEYRLLMMGAGLDYRFSGISGVIKRVLMLTGWKPYGYQVVEAIKKDKRIYTIPATYQIVDIYRQSYCTVSYFTIPHANLALAEAVEIGTVAIAPKTEESIEYSDNGTGALLFEINNPDDFISSFEYLVNNYDSVKNEVKKHSDAVRELFSPRLNIAKLNMVCEKAVGK